MSKVQILASGEDLTRDEDLMRGLLSSISTEDLDFNLSLMMAEGEWNRRYVQMDPAILAPQPAEVDDPEGWRRTNWGWEGDSPEVRMTTHPHGILFEMTVIEGDASVWIRKLMESVEAAHPGRVDFTASMTIGRGPAMTVLSTDREGGAMTIRESDLSDEAEIAEITRMMGFRHPARRQAMEP